MTTSARDRSACRDPGKASISMTLELPDPSEPFAFLAAVGGEEGPGARDYDTSFNEVYPVLNAFIAQKSLQAAGEDLGQDVAQMSLLRVHKVARRVFDHEKHPPDSWTSFVKRIVKNCAADAFKERGRGGVKGIGPRDGNAGRIVIGPYVGEDDDGRRTEPPVRGEVVDGFESSVVEGVVINKMVDAVAFASMTLASHRSSTGEPDPYPCAFHPGGHCQHKSRGAPPRPCPHRREVFEALLRSLVVAGLEDDEPEAELTETLAAHGIVLDHQDRDAGRCLDWFAYSLLAPLAGDLVIPGLEARLLKRLDKPVDPKTKGSLAPVAGLCLIVHRFPELRLPDLAQARLPAFHLEDLA